MSVLDELRDLERRVASRMQELRPLVDEYRDLERVAQRLGVDGTDRASTISMREADGRSRRQTRTAPKRPTTRRSSASRSPRHAKPSDDKPSPNGGGKRQSQVLAAVKRRPGITVREIGEQLGVDYTSLYRHVRALEADGKITKHGRTLQPG